MPTFKYSAMNYEEMQLAVQIRLIAKELYLKALEKAQSSGIKDYGDFLHQNKTPMDFVPAAIAQLREVTEALRKED